MIDKRPLLENSMGLIIRAAALLLSVSIMTAFAETKYRTRFNEEGGVQKEEVQQNSGMTEVGVGESIEDKKEKQVNTKKAVQSPSELEKQQKILEQYKPLIEARTYKDMLEVTEPAPPLILNRLPHLGEAIIPGRAPNIRLIPYLLKSFEHAGYKASYQGVEYYLAVNCEGSSSFDDCSTIPHNQFRNRAVYVRFLQSSDPRFTGVKGMKVGDSFGQVSHLFEKSATIHGNGECLRTRDKWLACFDGNKMAINKKRLQMMPANNARLLRFLRVEGRGY